MTFKSKGTQMSHWIPNERFGSALNKRLPKEKEKISERKKGRERQIEDKTFSQTQC